MPGSADEGAEAGCRGSTAGCHGSIVSWAASLEVGCMHRRVSVAPNSDDRADGTDGVDDTADEAAAGRSELFRALSFSNSFFRCRHLIASSCNFLFLFQNFYNFNLI